MGGLCNKEKKKYSKVDINGDGIITRKEFDIWEERIKRLEMEKDNELKNSYEIKIRELEKENEILKNMKSKLEKENTKLVKLINDKSNCKDDCDNNSISRVVVRNYVKEMLKDDNINVDYFPDYVERAIYENVFVMILSMMKHMGDETSIKLLGHEIGMRVKSEDCKSKDTDISK